MDKIIAPLMRVAAFQGLTRQQFQGIARHAIKLKFLRGDVITKAGSPGNGAFVIASGPAECLATSADGSNEAVVPGTLIGEMAMLIEHDYQATVIARDWVFCLKITRAGMHEQMREDPSLAEHFQRRVTERLLQVAEDLRRIDGILAAQAEPVGAAAHPHARIAARPIPA
jgi:signal-transduction protein with cAMP-binding, CBS, and nucleotidyltransferase domain